MNTVGSERQGCKARSNSVAGDGIAFQEGVAAGERDFQGIIQ
jgi:hypothetical protein